jgi:hypothetical protein
MSMRKNNRRPAAVSYGFVHKTCLSFVPGVSNYLNVRHSFSRIARGHPIKWSVLASRMRGDSSRAVEDRLRQQRRHYKIRHVHHV